MNNEELLTQIKAMLEDEAARKSKCDCPTCEAFCLTVTELINRFGTDARDLLFGPLVILSRRLAMERAVHQIMSGEGVTLIEMAEQQTTNATKH